MKKRIMSIIALVMVCTLTACSSKREGDGDSSSKAEGEKEGGVVLNMMLTGGGQWEDKLQPIVDKYYEETGVKVEFECYEHNNYFPAMEAKMNAKSDTVDIIGVDDPMTAAYAEKGYIVPLNDYFSEEEINEFVPASVNSSSWDGKFYSPPMNTSSQILYYNKTFLEEAGIAIPEMDPNNRLTWEELVKTAESVVGKVDPDGAKGINGIVFEQANEGYQMLALPNSLGEKAIGDDGLSVDGIINTEGWIKAMTFVHDLYESGLAPRGLTSTENQSTFTSGKTIFLIGGSWVANSEFADGFEWGYTYCPAFEGYEDKVATPTGSWHFGVSAYSKQTEAAAEFIKYMSLGEGNDMWLEANGDVPARTAAVDQVISDPKYEEFPKSVQRIAAYEAANTAVARPITPAYSEYNSVLNATLVDIENGADPVEALGSCIEQANYLMEAYK